MSADVIAVLVSDIHLSHKPPIARSVEEDWYRVMYRYLEQLANVAEGYGVPVVCGGDIFDKWNPPPELINFALKHLPKMYAVPGQHDLPYHNYKDIEKSAYWTLVEAGVVKDLKPGIHTPVPGGDLRLTGVPWGHSIVPADHSNKYGIDLLVVHAYIWQGTKCYPGAPADQEVSYWRGHTNLDTYDAAVFGDNHKGFLSKNDGKGAFIMNCGTFMRRKIDERKYKPAVGLLLSNGDIKRYELDVSEDQFISVQETAELAEKGLELLDFMNELGGLGKKTVEFGQVLHEYFKKHKVASPVREIILAAMESAGG